MNKTYSEGRLAHIREQALIYRCACPAQVCVAIEAIRVLYSYQINCLDDTDTDQAVHLRIKDSAERSHAELEECLTDILKKEGWNIETLKMPSNLKKRLLGEGEE